MALIALYILKICYLCKSKTIINGKLIFTQQSLWQKQSFSVQRL